MSEQLNPEEWVTTPEAAKMSGYRQSNIRRALIAGALPGRKLGRFGIIRKSDVLDYVRRMRDLGTQKHTPRSYIKGEE